MLDLLFSQQGITSFWFPLLAGFIIFLLHLLTSKPKNDGKRDSSPMTFQQVNQNIQQTIYVKHTQQARNTRRRSSNNDDASGFVALLFLAGGLYQAYEVQVIQVMVGLIVFVFTLWLSTILHAYQRDIIHGSQWQAFLITTLAFVGVSFYLMYVAQHPVYVTEEASNTGFGKLHAIMEASYKVLGIAFVFGGLLTILATLTHYITKINVVYSGSPSNASRWILRFTQRFSNPISTGVILTIVFAIAYAFVSGYIYHLIRP